MTPREHAIQTTHRAFTVTPGILEADATTRLERWFCLVCGLELEAPPARPPQEEER
jgi:glycine cleavage system aminomethyltransferase T